MNNFVKRLALGVVALATSFVGIYAQSSSSRSFSVSWSDGSDSNSFYELLDRKPQEVKVNLISTTMLLRPEIAYDYTFNQEISVGGRTSFTLDNEGVSEALGKFQLSPYVRWHFYKETRGNALRGFYVEANMAYTYYDDIAYNPNVYYDSEGKMGYEITDKEGSGSAFGLGIGLGYKWITRRAWTFELGGFVGRNIVHPGHAPIYGNYVFSIGKRF